MMLIKILSGAQTGSDLAGLIAAKEFGLETGGWMPHNFTNEQGRHPEFVELYNVQEHQSHNFKPRTWANVRDSDGTIRFATDFKSSGEVCTRDAIRYHKKPHLDVRLEPAFLVKDYEKWQKRVADWIVKNKIKVLNVAGNRESTSPGLSTRVQKLLKGVFEILETNE